MAADRKRVQIQYRKLDDPQGYFGQMSLQDAIRVALGAERNGGPMRDRADRRSQGEDPAYGTVLLNEIHEAPSQFFGELVRFEKGAQLQLLSMAGDGISYNLVQANAPKDHEPLKGVLYFMVFGDHVTLIPGEIAPGRLERFLRWLLSTASSVISASSGVVLAPTTSVTDGVNPLPFIDRVTYSPQPFRPVDFDQQGIPLQEDEGSERQVVATNHTVRVLMAAGIEDTDIQRLMQDKTEIQVTLEINFKDGRRNKPIGMDTVNRMFRNVDPEDLTLRDPGGAQLQGRLMKLTYTADVETIGSLLNPNDVARKLREAYEHFVRNGHIHP